MNIPASNENRHTVTRNDIAASRYSIMRHRIIELRHEIDRLRAVVMFYRALSFGLAVALVIGGIFL